MNDFIKNSAFAGLLTAFFTSIVSLLSLFGVHVPDGTSAGVSLVILYGISIYLFISGWFTALHQMPPGSPPAPATGLTTQGDTETSGEPHA